MIPWPREWQPRGGALALSGRITASDGSLDLVAAALAESLSASTGHRFAASHGSPGDGDIALDVDPSLGGEAYRLVIDRTAALRAATPRAAGLAVSTFAQIVSSEDGRALLPRLTLEDEPDCGYRGLLVDVARHWHPPSTLRALVLLCWFYRINHLQLHLTDDQSFAFPSKAFPRLATPGHSYTPEELAGLVAFADARGVTLVPEIDMPGHGAAAIAAMPELFRVGDTHASTLNFARPEAVAALHTLVDEALAMFPASPWFHMGGDECDLALLGERPDFRRAFAREGVQDAHGLYAAFVNGIDAHVRARGRKLLVWEGFRHGALPEVSRHVTVMAFESAYHLPDCLLRDGYAVINTSWEPLYVVNEKRWEPAEIHAWDRFRWKPVDPRSPAWGGLSVAPTPMVLGAQMCAWEQTAELEVSSLRLRLPAMSERLWNPACGRGFGDFAGRLADCDERLGKLLHSPQVFRAREASS